MPKAKAPARSAKPVALALAPEEARDLLILLNRVHEYRGLQEAQRAVQLGVKLQEMSRGAAPAEDPDGENATPAS